MIRIACATREQARAVVDRLLNGNVDFAFNYSKRQQFDIMILESDLTRAKVCLSDCTFCIHYAGKN